MYLISLVWPGLQLSCVIHVSHGCSHADFLYSTSPLHVSTVLLSLNMSQGTVFCLAVFYIYICNYESAGLFVLTGCMTSVISACLSIVLSGLPYLSACLLPVKYVSLCLLLYLAVIPVNKSLLQSAEIIGHYIGHSPIFVNSYVLIYLDISVML